MDDRIRRLRIDRGLTQVEIHRLTGISINYYSRIERGLCYPNFRQAILLADLFNVSLDYLLQRKNDPTLYMPSESYRKKRAVFK